MSVPLISVVMPVYNAERYLALAVESVLRQTLGNFELIAVDDGSKDGSLAILREYEAGDSRVRIVSRPNTGIVGALNDGLAVATGEFIARMDADDLCRADRFELQAARLRSDPGLVAIGSCATSIDPDGEPLAIASVPLTHEEIEAEHLRGVTAIFHPAVMMRTEAVQRLGGYRAGTCPCEDYDLWLRLGEVGRLANLPEPLFTWRRTATGIVAGSGARMQGTIERVLGEAWRRRGLVGKPSIRPYTMMDRVDLYRQWGWQALKFGHGRTAAKYAVKSVLAEPWRGTSWRLLYCAGKAYFTQVDIRGAKVCGGKA